MRPLPNTNHWSELNLPFQNKFPFNHSEELTLHWHTLCWKGSYLSACSQTHPASSLLLPSHHLLGKLPLHEEALGWQPARSCALEHRYSWNITYGGKFDCNSGGKLDFQKPGWILVFWFCLFCKMTALKNSNSNEKWIMPEPGTHSVNLAHGSCGAGPGPGDVISKNSYSCHCNLGYTN